MSLNSRVRLEFQGLQSRGKIAVIAIGGNLPGEYGSSKKLLEASIAIFPAQGITIIQRSCWWSSLAWPDPVGPDYRNAVLIVEPSQPPEQMIQTLLNIESMFGRARSTQNAPRTLDLDLIAHGDSVFDQPDLVLPHPRAHQRLFVMGPLAEIMPSWIHPTLGKTASQLAGEATVGLDAHPVNDAIGKD